MKNLQNSSLKKSMDNQRIIIESLATDLKRVALGLHRGSYAMAERFREEAFKRSNELENQKTEGYINKLPGVISFVKILSIKIRAKAE